MEFRKILVTSDLSSESCVAFPVASSLAQKFGASVEVLTVIDASPQISAAGPVDAPAIYFPKDAAALMDDARATLNELVKEPLPTATVTVLESKGSIQETIIRYSQESNCDLIVIASHGRSGIARVLFGSIAEYVYRHAERCTLAVPVKK